MIARYRCSTRFHRYRICIFNRPSPGFEYPRRDLAPSLRFTGALPLQSGNTALSDRADVMVLVATGGRSLDAIPGTLPSNARVARFLPYKWLMPKSDAVVTNGGYGTVNHALSVGIPIVVSGRTEDKAEVAARVAAAAGSISRPTRRVLRCCLKPSTSC